MTFSPRLRSHMPANKRVFNGDGGAYPEIHIFQYPLGMGRKDEELEDEQKQIEETTLSTKASLEKIINARLSAAQPKRVPKQFIKCKPSHQAVAFNSGAKERDISGSPPVPIMHSPPRLVTVKDQQGWKIPPCISNWKNPKGYTIPLDKRLAADEGLFIAVNKLSKRKTYHDSGRDRPVEFEADPFGLDQFLAEVKQGKKGDGGGNI